MARKGNPISEIVVIYAAIEGFCDRIHILPSYQKIPTISIFLPNTHNLDHCVLFSLSVSGRFHPIFVNRTKQELTKKRATECASARS